jgi:biopolymer transport protein ExbD
MGLLRKQRKHREILEFSLNITSLMDVLTVLLFFLIKSFSVSSAVLNTPADLHLPENQAKAQIEETVSVSLSPNELRANDKVILRLANGTFRPEDIGPDRTILKLKAFLDEQMQKRNAILGLKFDRTLASEGGFPPGRIIVQSDRNLVFGTVKYVLHTAAKSNYNDYQFIVQNPED